MKRLLHLSLMVISFAVLLAACGDKGGSNSGGTNEEENLVISLSPDPGTGLNTTLNSTYTINLIIQSKMPPQGVNIVVKYEKEAGGGAISATQNLSATSSPVAITLPTVTNEIGIVTITVTSKTKSSNTVTRTFRLVKK